MKCVFCGGKLKNKNVTFSYEAGNNRFFVENVPAEVCSSCGEQTYQPEIADKLLKYARMQDKASKTIEVPVHEFA